MNAQCNLDYGPVLDYVAFRQGIIFNIGTYDKYMFAFRKTKFGMGIGTIQIMLIIGSQMFVIRQRKSFFIIRKQNEDKQLF